MASHGTFALPVLPLRYQPETTHKNKTAMFFANIAVKFIESSKP